MLDSRLVGSSQVVEHVVQENHTIYKRVDSRLPKILGTFVLCEWMEVIAGQFTQRFLPQGWLSLGRNINLSHYAPANLSDKVNIKIVVKEISSESLLFKITAKCHGRIIAKAAHKRMLVNAAIFSDKK